MNIRDEELLYRYFERQMSNAEEQNFLIDVAARDDMRMAFRSQLELLKAVRRDKDVLPGAAFVRERTLSALGFAGVVLPAMIGDEEEANAAPVSTTSTWKTMFTKPLALLSGGLLVGSLATYLAISPTQQAAVPVQKIAEPVPTELRIEVPAEQAAKNVAAPSKEVAKAVRSTHPALHEQTANAPSETAVKKNEGLPLVNKSEPAQVISKKPTIVRTPEK